jgi:haloacid dehalogenase superfamily, subfamily IA, variant 3 with third motif having DD or ED
MSSYLAVLTDVDGTMARSETVHGDALKQAAKAYYGVELTDQQIHDINGLGAKKRFELVQNERAKAGLDPNIDEDEFREHLAAYFLTHWKQIEPMPGAKEFLNRAANKGLRQAAVTNSQADIAEVALASLGKDRAHLEFMIAIEDVAEGKPSPEGYLKAAAKMGLTTPEQRARIIVLEDSWVGVEAAKAAGMTVIQTQPDPSHVHPDADLVVPRIDDPRVEKFVGFGPAPSAFPSLGRAA